MRLVSKTILAGFLTCLGASSALADDPQGNSNSGTPGSTAAPTNPKQLPPSQSSHDTAPPVASPDVTLPAGGVVEQAGVGGETAYGRPGVLELGGAAGLTIASGVRDFNFSPSIGWFIADNLEISGILSVANVKADTSSATVWSAVAEPSYHLPFNRTVFGFLGMGIGAAYEQSMGTGLAVAPRIGANVLVGRSGILTPSLTYEYITHNTSMDANNVTLVAVTSALRVNVGYTAMW